MQALGFIPYNINLFNDEFPIFSNIQTNVNLHADPYAQNVNW